MTERLDALMVRMQLVSGREKAKELIKSGSVYVDGAPVSKASTPVDGDKQSVEIRGSILPYVSRGGLKLAKAVEEFKLDLKDCVCMDIGASTGGFTDVCLQNGARLVYAIDVGHDQLAESLREDSRVISMERQNFRYCTKDMFAVEPDVAVSDVSFISLTLILGPAYSILKPGGTMVCLIKPQFEAGKSNIGKNGVVKDKKVHTQVIKKVTDFALSLGFEVKGVTESPIKGPEGNTEYLLWLQKSCNWEITK